MCWSAPVSIVFSLGLFAAAAVLYRQGRKAENNEPTVYSPTAKWHALFVGNIACVELCEFLIWLDVRPLSDMYKPCPGLNLVGTYGVFVFGFMNWVWLIALWAYKSSDGGKEPTLFKIPLLLGVLTTLSYCARLYDGDSSKQNLFYNERFVRRENMTIYTCSYQDTGNYDHLLWRFNFAQNVMYPNGYAWFVTVLVPMLFYKPRGLGLTCLVWGFCTYVIPTLFIPAQETMSLY